MKVGQFIEAFAEAIPFVVKNTDGSALKSFKPECEVARADIDWENKNLVIFV